MQNCIASDKRREEIRALPAPDRPVRRLKDALGELPQNSKVLDNRAAYQRSESVAKMTVGELRRALESLPDDMEISFEGGLTFNRLKRWSDYEVVIIWAEIAADLSPAFRHQHPAIKLAFEAGEEDAGNTTAGPNPGMQQ